MFTLRNIEIPGQVTYSSEMFTFLFFCLSLFFLRKINAICIPVFEYLAVLSRLVRLGGQFSFKWSRESVIRHQTTETLSARTLAATQGFHEMKMHLLLFLTIFFF